MRPTRTLAAIVTSTVLAAVVPTGVAAAGGPPDEPTTGACAFTPLEDQTYSTWVGLPSDPAHTPDRGRAKVTLQTNHGAIPLVLDRAKGPCAVRSFTFLTHRRYYDHTDCHRLTAYRTPPSALSVLQCGDPLGTGWGDPGYSFKDELDAANDLDNWPGTSDGSRKVYPRGTLAMANGGPDTNGSQFFLVYEDSRLSPDYTVFGSVSPRGMRVLDKIAAAGVDPAAEDAPEDGAPALATTIERAKPGGR